MASTHYGNDLYGVYEKVVELNGTMTHEQPHYFNNAPCKGCEGSQVALDELTATYKTAEKELISLISTQARPINTVAELLALFRNSCFGFAAMGHRFDVVKKKITGETLTKRDAFAKSIDNDNSCILGFGNTFDDFDFGDFGYRGTLIEQIVRGAYNDELRDASTDLTAMANCLLLMHFNKTKCKHSAEYLIPHDSCMKMMTTKNWRNRSLVGYCGDADNGDAGFNFTINKDFVKIFSDKVALWLSNSDVNNSEYFAVEDLREELLRSLTKAYLGWCGNIKSTFHDVCTLINTVQDSELTDDEIAALNPPAFFDNSSVLIQHVDMEKYTYVLNKKGLVSFLDTITTLGLGNADTKILADKLKSVA